MVTRTVIGVVTACAFVGVLLVPGAAGVGDGTTVSNLERQSQRQREYLTADYSLLLARRTAQNLRQGLAIQVKDPGRTFVGNVCWELGWGCAGDVRLYDWGSKEYGLVKPVLFTNRVGATISGHVWATVDGPARRPGIVITNGSIQASEQMYWWAAQTLAKAGYVVITSDPQQQGRSDELGEGVDVLEGTPAQVMGNTFYDGTQDALDFLLSTPNRRYCPRLSRSGHSHCAKQQKRVEQGLDAAYNPLWQMVDRTKIGLAGHSFGSQGVSYMAQKDKRVDAVVAWDNLCVPSACFRHPPGAVPPLRVPALGISNDFLGGPLPTPIANSTASQAMSATGIDSAQLIIRGGTHFEYSYLPMSTFPATLRGMDFAAWYTRAWFDKYLRHAPYADTRLLTTRWQHDSGDLRIDPDGGGNLFSEVIPSRMDIHLDNGRRFTCEDLHAGCSGMSMDHGPAEFSYYAIVTSPDR